jgi:hypothetical protein
LKHHTHILAIAKGRGHRAEGRREKIEGLRFQYLARVLIALATAITQILHLEASHGKIKETSPWEYVTFASEQTALTLNPSARGRGTLKSCSPSPKGEVSSEAQAQ